MSLGITFFIVPWMIKADDQTAVTSALNAMIASSSDCVYCGGNGIVIRNPFDGYEDATEMHVVPTTFWVNDVVVPSQIYPDTVMGEDIADASYRASVAYVIGNNLGKLLPDIDNIHSDDWGWGVFYATDSNAADGRCRWLSDDNGYDCPGGWVSADDLTFIADDPSGIHSGAGWYDFGNPYAGGGGGGTGAHFEFKIMGLDEEYACDSKGVCLTSNNDSQCNQDLKGNGWVDWINHWFTHRGGDKISVDQAACWVNNIRDLVELQNAHFWKGYGPNAKPVEYWGWNEIPLDRVTLNDPLNWDAVLINVPTEICKIEQGGDTDTIACLNEAAHWKLEENLDKWINSGKLVPGMENAGNRPGSYVVFARTFLRDGSWLRWFYCEPWMSPGGKYEIVSHPWGDNDGACVIQFASGAHSPNVTTTSSGLTNAGMVTMV